MFVPVLESIHSFDDENEHDNERERTSRRHTVDIIQGLFQQLNIKPDELLIQAVGFIILAFMLTKFLIRPINNLLEERTNTIQGKLDDAEKARQEMISMRGEYEQRINNIETEARERIQEATKEAHAARDLLLAEAREQSEKLIERGKEEIQREKDKALVEIRDQVADLAILAAGQIIEKSLDDAAHRALIDDILNDVKMN